MIDYLTITGGLVAPAERRLTQSGKSVANFRIAESDSKKNEQGGWDTTDRLFLPVSIWNENPQFKKNPIPWSDLAMDLKQGQRIAIRGKLITREWQAQDGSKRSQIELKGESFYVIPEEPQAQNSGGFGQPQPTGGFGQAPQGGFNQTQQPVVTPNNDPWNSAPPAGGFGGSDDNPPF